MGRTKMNKNNQKRNSALNKYLSLKNELSSLTSNKENTPLNFYYHSSNKQTRASTHFSNSSGHSKKINVSAFELDTILEEIKNYEKQHKNSNIKTIYLRSKSALEKFNDFSNNLNELNIEEEKIKKNSVRKLYSNEFMEFQNEVTGKLHYVKQYKEDEIPFTKSKILPEIQWQDLDNDVLTSEEQKKSAFRKEMNWIGDAINQIQNNEKYFKNHVTMYKLSQKYPKN